MHAITFKWNNGTYNSNFAQRKNDWSSSRCDHTALDSMCINLNIALVSWNSYGPFNGLANKYIMLNEKQAGFYQGISCILIRTLRQHWLQAPYQAPCPLTCQYTDCREISSVERATSAIWPFAACTGSQ